MTTIDWAYVALIAAMFLVDHFVIWRAFVRRSQIDPARARLGLWAAWMIMSWSLTLIGIAIWIFEGRAWTSIGINLPAGWRLWGGLSLILSFMLVQCRGMLTITRSAPQADKVRGQLGKLAILLPHEQSELRWFAAASATAGFCEEFIFRGYLIWAFQSLLGWWGAAVLSLSVFIAAHAYQGPSGLARVAIAGAFLTVLVGLFGSLLPAILIHALGDLSSGATAWLVLRKQPLEHA